MGTARKQEETRRHTRLPVSLQVMLRYGPIGLLRAQARNLSLEGMFINTGQVSLPRGVTVELMFTLPDTGALHAHQLAATVVHTSGEGVGLAFVRTSVPTATAIQRFLQEEPHPALN